MVGLLLEQNVSKNPIMNSFVNQRALIKQISRLRGCREIKGLNPDMQETSGCSLSLLGIPLIVGLQPHRPRLAISRSDTPPPPPDAEAPFESPINPVHSKTTVFFFSFSTLELGNQD